MYVETMSSESRMAEVDLLMHAWLTAAALWHDPLWEQFGKVRFLFSFQLSGLGELSNLLLGGLRRPVHKFTDAVVTEQRLQTSCLQEVCSIYAWGVHCSLCSIKPTCMTVEDRCASEKGNMSLTGMVKLPLSKAFNLKQVYNCQSSQPSHIPEHQVGWLSVCSCVTAKMMSAWGHIFEVVLPQYVLTDQFIWKSLGLWQYFKRK